LEPCEDDLEVELVLEPFRETSFKNFLPANPFVGLVLVAQDHFPCGLLCQEGDAEQFQGPLLLSPGPEGLDDPDTEPGLLLDFPLKALFERFVGPQPPARNIYQALGAVKQKVFAPLIPDQGFDGYVRLSRHSLCSLSVSSSIAGWGS
jgi:hypothetical protein